MPSERKQKHYLPLQVKGQEHLLEIHVFFLRVILRHAIGLMLCKVSSHCEGEAEGRATSHGCGTTGFTE